MYRKARHARFQEELGRAYAGQQCDASQVGLARVFQMNDRSFRLDDHGRYLAKT